MPITRRALLGAAGIAAASAYTKTTADRQKPPNILFILSDDHGYQAISAYGSRLNRTPNIDRLAEEGMLFRRCLVTDSLCAPSRASILTGKYSHLNGVLNNAQRFDNTQVTFPSLLRDAGYQTALFGKWHLQSDPVGVDTWEVLPGQGHYYNPDFRTPSGPIRREGHVTQITTDRTLAWLNRERDPRRPWLLMCNHKAPHRNWFPAPDQLTRFDGVNFPEPETLFDNYENRANPAKLQRMEIGRDLKLAGDLKVPPLPGEDPKAIGYPGYRNEYSRMTEQQRRMWDAVYSRKAAKFRSLNPQGKELTRWKYRRFLEDYLACVQSVDESVGSLLRWLDANGEAENTIVVYSSDQGFYLGEHGWFDKRWMYTESLRTPLLVRWPSVTKPGSESARIVSNIDIAETFLDAAGAKIPGDMQGRSVVPLLRGETPADWRQSFYYHYYEDGGEHNVPRQEGVTTENYKLIHYYDSGEWELFDLKEDPHELRNVYGRPPYSHARTNLEKELERLRVELKVGAKDPDRQ